VLLQKIHPRDRGRRFRERVDLPKGRLVHDLLDDFGIRLDDVGLGGRLDLGQLDALLGLDGLLRSGRRFLLTRSGRAGARFGLTHSRLLALRGHGRLILGFTHMVVSMPSRPSTTRLQGASDGYSGQGPMTARRRSSVLGWPAI